MLKFVFAILVFGICLSPTFSQQYIDDLSPLMNYRAVEAGPHGVNLVQYIPTGMESLLELMVGLGPGARITDFGVFDYSWMLPEIAGFVYASQRFYVKRNNLVRREVNSYNNAGNYFAIRGIYSQPLNRTQPFGMQPAAMVNVHYGIQRSFKNGRGAWNVHGGIGYGYSLEAKMGNTYPAVGFKFQWKFNKNQT